MDENFKSRTQKKNEDRALQKLGEQLLGLSSEQLEDIEMPEELLEAVRAARTIKSHGAKRRQMNYIGALMRDTDHVPIRNALENIRQGNLQKSLAFKKIETWRDELKQGNKELIEEILTSCPDAERQRLTQLSRNAGKEYISGKGVKSSRLLFRYLKQISQG
jgi:ribosome-associated protein